MLTSPETDLLEKAVLGGMLLDSTIIPRVVEVVAESDFANPTHAAVFGACVRLGVEGVSPTPATLLSRLKASPHCPSYVDLATLEQSCLSSSGSVEAAGLVKEHACRRAVRRLSENIIRCVDNGDDFETVARMAKDGLWGLTLETRKSEIQTFAEHATEAAWRIREEVEAKRSGAPSNTSPWGFADLDRLTGGYRAGCLTVLAARPSIGKSAVALKILLNSVLSGRPSAFFSIEMPHEMLWDRIFATTGKVPLDKITRKTANDGELNKINMAGTNLSEFPCYLIDCPVLSGADLSMQVQNLKAQMPELKLVIVDGLWLMKHPSERGLESMTDRIGATSKRIRRVAREYGVHVLLLHQLSRDVEKRATNRERESGSGARPQLSDLRSSGDIEQDADTVMFIHREKTTHDDIEAPMMIETDIIVAKNRQGPIGDIRLLYELRTQDFHNMYDPRGGAKK